MDSFTADCPRCGIRRVAFTIKDEWVIGSESAAGAPMGVAYQVCDTFAICGHCKRGVVATFKANSLDGISPSPPRPPKHTPTNVARFFEQAMDNLPNNWDAAGGMFRKALDTGLKSKFPKMKGDLCARIKEAAAKQKLTPELAKWSHQIRLGGNDAMHEEEPFSEKDAQRLADFTKLVLLYLFTLPGMLDRASGLEPPR